MKAKFYIGMMIVEVEGDTREISDLISQQADLNRIKITSPTPRPKPKSGSGKKTVKNIKGKKKREAVIRWSSEENSTLKELYNAKKTISEICKILGRTEKSVYQRIIILRNKGELNEV